MESRTLLGQLLVDACIITGEQLQGVLEAQKLDDRKLGSLLVERGLINETQLTQILSQQLSVPWVSLYHVDFSKRLLSLVPFEVAEKYCLVPIYVRHVRGQGDTLYVAMDDPTNEEALKTCSIWAGLPTRPMIASPTDIRNAIDFYYGGLRRASNPPPGSVPPKTRKEAPEEKQPEPAPQVGAESAVPAGLDEPRGPSSPGSPAAPQEPAASGQADEPTAQQPPGEPQAQPSPSAEPAEQPATFAFAREPDSEQDRETAEIAPTPKEHEDSQAMAPTEPSADDEPRPDAVVEPRTEASVEDDGSVEVGEELPLEAVLPRGKTIPLREGTAEDPPRMPRTGPQRLMAMTLLDGTRLALPVRKGRKQRPVTAVGLVRHAAEPPSEASESENGIAPIGEASTSGGSPSATSTREVVAALRAAARGLDVPELAGVEPKWQAICAALLRLMLRKGVITDEEFLEELKKV